MLYKKLNLPINLPLTTYEEFGENKLVIDIVNEIANKYNLVVIEDTAQAFGAEHHCGKYAGMLADCGTFSFYKTKNISTFERHIYFWISFRFPYLKE